MLNKTISKLSARIVERIARNSKANTVDLVVNHELKGISPEMVDWWWDNIDTTDRYKLWHPKDHKFFTWEKSPECSHVGAVHEVIETIKFPTLLRIRWENPNSISIPKNYIHKLAASILNKSAVPFAWLLHEYESTEYGIKLRTTFRLPEKVPKWFLKALHKHNIEEISQFEKFLPELYKNAVKLKQK